MRRGWGEAGGLLCSYLSRTWATLLRALFTDPMAKALGSFPLVSCFFPFFSFFFSALRPAWAAWWALALSSIAKRRKRRKRRGCARVQLQFCTCSAVPRMLDASTLNLQHSASNDDLPSPSLSLSRSLPCSLPRCAAHIGQLTRAPSLLNPATDRDLWPRSPAAQSRERWDHMAPPAAPEAATSRLPCSLSLQLRMQLQHLPNLTSSSSLQV